MIHKRALNLTARIVVVFAISLFRAAITPAAPQVDQIQPEVTYFHDDIQAVLQIEKLIQAENWPQMATVTDQFLSNALNRTAPFSISVDSQAKVLCSANSRVFALNKLSQWFSKYPEALAAYQDYVSSRAENQYEDASRSLFSVERFIDRYAFSRQGQIALMTLGDYYYLDGRIQEAKVTWSRLLSDANRPRKTTNRNTVLKNRDETTDAWRYPNPSIDQASVLARLLVLEIINGAPAGAAKKIDEFKSRWPNATFEINGKKVTWSYWLESQFKRDPKFDAVPEQQSESDPDIVDTAMQQLWSATENNSWRKLSDRFSEICLPSGRSFSLQRRIKPVIIDDQVLWQSGKSIRSVEIKTGQTSFPTGTSWDEDTTMKGTIWRLNSEFDTDDISPIEQCTGIPEFEIIPAGNHVFARVGDPLVAAKRNSTSSSSQIVGLDLMREGRVLAGFPLRPPSSSFEFLGSPIVDETGIFVVLQKSVGTQIEIHIAHYDGKIANTNEPAIPRWITLVARGETHGQYCAGNFSRSVLSNKNGSVIFGGILGTVASIKKADGRIQWLVRYPRSPLTDQSPDHQMLNYFRAEALFSDSEQLLVMPADFPDILCIDSISGHVIWRQELPDAVYALGEDDQHFFVSGDRLYWLNKKSGEIVTSYPGYQGTVSLGDSRGATRGIGKGMVCDNTIAFPINRKILLFDQKLTTDPRTNTRVPRIKRVLHVPENVNQLSEIHFHRGTLLVVGDKKITAFR